MGNAPGTLGECHEAEAGPARQAHLKSSCALPSRRYGSSALPWGSVATLSPEQRREDAQKAE